MLHHAASRAPRDAYLGDLDYAGWAEVLETNLFGPLRVTEALLANLRAGQRRQVVIITGDTGVAATSDSGGDSISTGPPRQLSVPPLVAQLTRRQLGHKDSARRRRRTRGLRRGPLGIEAPAHHLRRAQSNGNGISATSMRSRAVIRVSRRKVRADYLLYSKPS